MRIIDYRIPFPRVVNADALPKCKGAPYLLVVEGIDGGPWIAKRWMRKLPDAIGPIEAVISFADRPPAGCCEACDQTRSRYDT